MIRKMGAALVGLGAVAAMTSAFAVVPVETGVGYAFHTDAVGACHSTNWFLYVDGDKSVDGYASWDKGHQRATITGKIGADNSFRGEGHLVGGNKTAAISGQVFDKYFTISVTGTGTPCDGISWKVPRQSWGGDAQMGG